ncbi:MAG: shikimate dehydrogenase [Treponemataceae bacterium]
MSSFEPTRVYGIIGYPLSHTLSPLLHTTAFRESDIPAVLVPWPLESNRLPAFVGAVRLLRIRGVCVTIPHKERILPLLDRVSDRAKAVGAVNLLYWDGDTLCGDNTDVPGFVAPLREGFPVPGARSALVLGAGGASRAVIAGLKSIGYDRVSIANRTEETARHLASEFGLEVCPWDTRGEVDADLVVNTTPLGMKGKAEDETPYPAGAFAGRKRVAYDIVYTPLRTRFLREAEDAGWRTISGLGMFIAQADYQFRAWTGLPLPDAAKAAVYQMLDCPTV